MPLARLLSGLMLFVVASEAWPLDGDFCRRIDHRQLAKMDCDQLNALFRDGRVDCMPTGYYRGHVLQMIDARHPRFRAATQNVVWKGKHFLPCGCMVNQWAGFKAVKAPVTTSESWLDGQPCISIDYPTDAPIFGNARDELREIAPGVFLGRVYERCPEPRLQGYFVLECECRKAPATGP